MHTTDLDLLSADPRHSARVVLPTEWAKMDVRILLVFNEIYDNKFYDAHKQLSIDKAPIIRNIDLCCGVSFPLWTM